MLARKDAWQGPETVVQTESMHQGIWAGICNGAHWFTGAEVVISCCETSKSKKHFVWSTGELLLFRRDWAGLNSLFLFQTHVVPCSVFILWKTWSCFSYNLLDMIAIWDDAVRGCLHQHFPFIFLAATCSQRGPERLNGIQFTKKCMLQIYKILGGLI